MINLNNVEQKREIRVFISSTFRDMMVERDHLAKVVFPELRSLCLSRGVEFTEVDLRWGVTEEQTQDGKVIEICLHEIDRCRPYFVGILGERYGWMPPKDEYTRHAEIIREFPWIAGDIDSGLSITEMEIQYGVLRNPDMIAHAFFYLRDEAATSHEFREAPNSDAENKLQHLKELLLTEHPDACTRFSDNRQLQAAIKADFTAYLDTEFPETEQSSLLERIRMEHAAYARSRLRVYIGGEKYFKHLDEHISGTDKPLVITGQSGGGKSALLSNWIAHHQNAYPDDFVLYHFIGGAPDSSDHYALIRRIMEEMKARFDLQDEIPTDPDEIEAALPIFLARTPQAEKWVLVIDALNQLEEKGDARWLGWLPNYFPDNVRVILSTLPGEAYDTLKKRQCPELLIDKLDLQERQALIAQYLGEYAKKLPQNLVAMISQSQSITNPLVLRSLLDELRLYGDHDSLQERVNYYLAAKDPEDFFRLILKRLEDDYETEQPGMVGDVLSLIWAARRGLSERELLAISAIPALFWTPLYRAIENHLVMRRGLLDFSHNFFRLAVEQAYLQTKKLNKKKRVQLRLADYFQRVEFSDRGLDELPYQLMQAEEWERLKTYVGHVEVLQKLSTSKREFELQGYWNRIGNRFDMVAVYKSSVELFEEELGTTSDRGVVLSKVLDDIATFFFLIAAKYEAAEFFYRQALTKKEEELGLEHPDTGRTLSNLGALLQNKGDYNGAEPHLRRALAIFEEALGAKHLDTATCQNNLAVLLCYKGDYDAAEPLLRRALAIREDKLGSRHTNTALVLSNLAGLLETRRDYDGAEQLYRRVLEIWEVVLGDRHPETAYGLNNLARLLEKRAVDGAEPLIRRALAIREEVLGEEHPDTASSLQRLAGIVRGTGNFDAAESLARRALAIGEKVLGASHPDMPDLLSTLGAVLDSKRDYVGAESCLQRALAIREEVLGEKHLDTDKSLMNLAQILLHKRDYEAAVQLFLRSIELRKKIYGPESSQVASTLANLAVVYRDNLQYEKAETMCARALEIYMKTLGPEHYNAINSAVNLALLKFRLEKNGEALTLCREHLDAHRRVHDKEADTPANQLEKLAECYHNVALHGDVPEQLWPEAEEHYQLARKYYSLLNDLESIAKVERQLSQMRHSSED